MNDRTPWRLFRRSWLVAMVGLGWGCQTPQERGYPPRPAILEAAAGGAPGVRADLIRLLGNSPEDDLRLLAARDLAMFRGPDVEAALAQALELDSEDDVRRQVCRSLAAIGGVSGIPALQKALVFDADKNTRKEAAIALGKLMARQAVPDLRHAAHFDPSSRVRKAALDALRHIGEPPGPPPAPRGPVVYRRPPPRFGPPRRW